MSLAAMGLALAACSTPPYRPESPPPPLLTPEQQFIGTSVGNEIAIRAIGLVGTPYLFGGDAPGGFDCSGLVRFVHNELGITVPRTAAEQFVAATKVGRDALLPGDLLFFRTQGRRISHVAIYAGNGRFVHAPQTGKTIELRELDEGYFSARFAGAGRLF